MRIVELQQGTPAWDEFRRSRFTASEAAAMLGVSKYMTRDQLLALKTTGLSPETSGAQQAAFDRGHAAEAAARQIAEEIIGSELFPCTVEDNAGELSASMDGLTMLGDIGWECKLWSADLAAKVEAGELEEHYKVQMDQQLLVSGAEKILFMCTDGTKEKCVTLWYTSNDVRFGKLLRGWQQFRKDMDSYEHVIDAPKPEAKFIGSLPVLNIRVQGQVVESNLDEYKEGALSFIRSINRNLQTDEDFADAEAAVKWCGEVEKKIELTKEQALAQTATIEQLFNALDEVKAEARRTRLDLDKLVSKRKDELKLEIVQKAKAEWQREVQAANAEFSPIYIENVPPADFLGAIKGKRSFSAMRSAVGAVLANAKIELGEVRDHIRTSLQIIRAEKDHQFLFNDAQQLVSLDHDHLRMKVESRIKDHKEAEERRIAAEAQRRAEEIARKQREEEDRLAREQQEREAAAAQQQPEEQAKPAQEQRQETPPATNATPIKAAPTSKAKAATPSRPTDAEIISVLALHFRVHESKVIAWLCDMDLELESSKLAENF